MALNQNTVTGQNVSDVTDADVTNSQIEDRNLALLLVADDLNGTIGLAGVELTELRCCEWGRGVIKIIHCPSNPPIFIYFFFIFFPPPPSDLLLLLRVVETRDNNDDDDGNHNGHALDPALIGVFVVAWRMRFYFTTGKGGTCHNENPIPDMSINFFKKLIAQYNPPPPQPSKRETTAAIMSMIRVLSCRASQQRAKKPRIFLGGRRFTP